MLCSSVVAFDSPTEPKVICVGHVEFTVLPVPPAAADVPLVELEAELEHPAAAAIVAITAVVSRTHMGMRGLRNVCSSPSAGAYPLVGLFTWRSQRCRPEMTVRLRRTESYGKRPEKVKTSCRIGDGVK
jgi:hypothetical protein